ncbi:uncharacterized protein AAES06_021034 isoform 1-T1 [Glossophaga mutica]
MTSHSQKGVAWSHGPEAVFVSAGVRSRRRLFREAQYKVAEGRQGAQQRAGRLGRPPCLGMEKLRPRMRRRLNLLPSGPLPGWLYSAILLLTGPLPQNLGSPLPGREFSGYETEGPVGPVGDMPTCLKPMGPDE